MEKEKKLKKIKAKPKKKMRTKPYSKINWEMVDELCVLHCTGEEISSLIGVNYDTLNAACKRVKGMGFSDYFKVKSAKGKASLRRRQYVLAEEGNTTMLVWLGKQWLGQTDRREVDLSSADGYLAPTVIEIVVPDESMIDNG